MLIPCKFPGVDGESFGPGDDSEFDLASREEEGSNLVDSGPSVVKQEPILLDFPRHPIDRGLFESHTYTGTFFRKLSDIFPLLYPPVSGLSHLSPFYFRSFCPFAQLETLQPDLWEQIHVGGHCQ